MTSSKEEQSNAPALNFEADKIACEAIPAGGFSLEK
jgi:hypothetical protein